MLTDSFINICSTAMYSYCEYAHWAHWMLSVRDDNASAMYSETGER